MRNLILINALLLFSSCSEHPAENSQSNNLINQDTTFWEVNENSDPGSKIMLIDNSYIIHYSEAIIDEGSVKMSDSKFHFIIKRFSTLKNNNYYSEYHDYQKLDFKTIDSSNIQINFDILGDKETLKLRKFEYDIPEKKELINSWINHLDQYNNDTLVEFKGNEFGLEFRLYNQGNNLYESVALIVDTADIEFDSYLGPDLIIQDKKTSELYQIPNFFKNGNHFYPLLFQETNIKRKEEESKAYHEKVMKYITTHSELKPGDTILNSELNIDYP